MLWLIICIFVAIIWSISAFIDNYQTDVVFRKNRPQSMKIFDGCSYLVAAAIVFFIFGIKEMPVDNILWIVAAGALGSVASIPYYLALRDEESTAAAVFYQLIPVIYLTADWLIFKQTITPIQLIGFFVILAAPAVIVFSRHRPQAKRLEFSAALLLILYVTLAAISGLATTHAGEGQDYYTMFFFFLIGRGAMDIILFAFNRSWQQRMKYIWQHKRKKYLIPAITNQTISIVGEFLSRYALIIGVASLVSVTYNVLELFFTFFLGIILSIIWPKFGREKLARHIIIAHLVAVILAIIGIIMVS